MRLRDLDGQFIYNVTADGSRCSNSDSIEGAQGVLFQCPSCGVGKERGVSEDGDGFIVGAHYIMVCFANPRGAPVAPTAFDKNPRWTMSGSSLDDLTLSPSVNCDIQGPNREPSFCKYHGWVKNGDVT
jgi:hypothetical protein